MNEKHLRVQNWHLKQIWFISDESSRQCQVQLQESNDEGDYSNKYNDMSIKHDKHAQHL